MATDRLFFLDESGVNTKMIRLYGRSRKGMRCMDKVPHGNWKTSTFIATLSHDGLVAPWVLDGPMNKEAFVTYLKAFPYTQNKNRISNPKELIAREKI